MGNEVRIPALLEEVIQWEHKIASGVSYLETPTGYFLQFNVLDNGGYSCSPLDSIMFARTGMDGIHFSFLTDFGAITDLSLAPIICVSPMDFGQCVRMVAANISDFFALHFSGHDGFLLNYFDTKEQYVKYLKKQENAEYSEFFNYHEWKSQKEKVSELAFKEFQFQPIEDAFEYVQSIRAQRNKDIVLHTLDSLGVAPVGSRKEKENYQPHSWCIDRIEQATAEEIEVFVNDVELETLFAFIRDCQERGVAENKVKGILQSALNKHGLEHWDQT